VMTTSAGAYSGVETGSGQPFPNSDYFPKVRMQRNITKNMQKQAWKFGNLLQQVVAAGCFSLPSNQQNTISYFRRTYRTVHPNHHIMLYVVSQYGRCQAGARVAAAHWVECHLKGYATSFWGFLVPIEYRQVLLACLTVLYRGIIIVVLNSCLLEASEN
jgi:hypothetical protein